MSTTVVVRPVDFDPGADDHTGWLYHERGCLDDHGGRAYDDSGRSYKNLSMMSAVPMHFDDLARPRFDG